MLAHIYYVIVTISVKGWRQFRPRKDCDIILGVNIWGYINMDNKYKIRNKRLSKYLYSLGFNRECCFDNKGEYWLFIQSINFKEAMDFYFYMRKKNR